MFRSRSPEECEQLYGLINHSRINNPTYIALQNARGPIPDNSWAAAMDRRNAARTSTAGSTTGDKSWWSFGGSNKSKSYRALSTHAGSVSANTDSSIGTMATAFSALKKFGGKGLLNMGKSQDGSFSSGSYNSSLGGSGTNTPFDNLPGGVLPLSIIKDTKIRLYVRESASKWRDLGAARLSIMQPEGQIEIPIIAGHNRRASFGSPAALQTGTAKRIVITGKTEGETLLDVTLSEGCFERVARTGIAVSVWEDVTVDGEVVTVAPTGGVGGQTVKVYMIQVSYTTRPI